jgi:hypothetical protein
VITLVNASLYGQDTVNVDPSFIETITEEKTEPACSTIRYKRASGHFRVMGTKEQVCEALGLNVKEVRSIL